MKVAMREFSTLSWFLFLPMVLPFLVKPALGLENESFLVWSQTNEAQFTLKVSRKIKKQWSLPETIEKSDCSILSPSISMMKNGDLYVLWTEFDGIRGRIRYKVMRNGIWESSQNLVTTTNSDFAPASIVDFDGAIWLVWSGTDDTDDDIYFSRWVGSQWQTPKKVNENDEWPDILPSLIIDSQDRITASWLGYNGDRYVRYSSYWMGENWSREIVIEKVRPEKVFIEPDLPDFVPDNSHGRIYFGISKPFQTFVKRSGKKSATIRR